MSLFLLTLGDDVNPTDFRDLRDFYDLVGPIAVVGAVIGWGISALADDFVRERFKIDTGWTYTFASMFIGAVVATTLLGASTAT